MPPPRQRAPASCPGTRGFWGVTTQDRFLQPLCSPKPVLNHAALSTPLLHGDRLAPGMLFWGGGGFWMKDTFPTPLNPCCT